MSHTDRLLGRRALRLVLAGCATALLAGCSSDVTRFADSDPMENPFSNSARFASNDTHRSAANTSYGYNGGGSLAAAPIGRVSSAPLAAPVQSAPLAPVRSAGLSAPAHQSPVRSAESYAAADMPTASTPAPISAGGTASAPHGLWTASGGTPITLAQGETIPMLSQRYGVPADALLKVNGYSSAAQVSPGTRLTIPVYQAGARVAESAAPVRASRPAVAPVRSAEAIAPVRSVPRVRPGMAAATKPAAAHEKLAFVKGPEAANARPGRPATPARVEAKVAKAEPARPAPQPVKTAAAPAPAPTKVAKLETPAPAPVQAAARVARVDSTTTASVPPAATATAPTTATADASESAAPEFRWPARGRIISGFKAGNNDGINIAVPEGTSVKAAEAGVVAYAGSELKGYGNLVLIRHPNGFVSAYANNGELDVKRGDTVKRGQTIAKSGQTGNVNSPQLHFELRKGQTPVDPTQYLAGL